ncbi:MAG: helix-turn-helix domain-containing protein [Synergistaceae bacterium]|nr:helix-turn-helix domain-containing protein [Synergistaceae bacterium]
MEQNFDARLDALRKECQELQKGLDFLRAGDALVIKKLDRLVRDLQRLSTPQGKLFFHIIRAVAEFERDLIARRRVKGRPTKLTPDKMTLIVNLLKSGMKIAAVAKQVGVSKATLYKRFPRDKTKKE